MWNTFIVPVSEMLTRIHENIENAQTLLLNFCLQIASHRECILQSCGIAKLYVGEYFA